MGEIVSLSYLEFNLLDFLGDVEEIGEISWLILSHCLLTSRNETFWFLVTQLSKTLTEKVKFYITKQRKEMLLNMKKIFTLIEWRGGINFTSTFFKCCN